MITYKQSIKTVFCASLISLCLIQAIKASTAPAVRAGKQSRAQFLHELEDDGPLDKGQLETSIGIGFLQHKDNRTAAQDYKLFIAEVKAVLSKHKSSPFDVDLPCLNLNPWPRESHRLRDPVDSRRECPIISLRQLLYRWGNVADSDIENDTIWNNGFREAKKYPKDQSLARYRADMLCRVIFSIPVTELQENDSADPLLFIDKSLSHDDPAERQPVMHAARKSMQEKSRWWHTWKPFAVLAAACCVAIAGMIFWLKMGTRKKTIAAK